MEALSDLDCKVALELRVVGYTNAEIASAMHCDPRTVKRNLLRRGMIKSRKTRNVHEDYKRIRADVLSR